MRWSALALALASIPLAGCGEDDRPLRAATVPGSAPIRVIADEYSFDPGQITVTGASGRLTFTLANRGTLAHNLTVLDGDRRVAGLRSFPAGEERSFRARIPAGDYRLVCTVADHEDKGMRGELTIRD